jgi:lipopolysaccharide transport system ATP-binding protein
MSADVVIRAEGLGKKYVIGHETERERYTALRDIIGRRTKALIRTTSDMLHGRAIVGGDITEEIWALEDVNFEIKRGEVVGIIGRNGAGKSTLLKILSRITEPTKGRVEIRGRVASLLEVGTGFHPELTGRENIYLNGAILGMKRAEIRRKFDEIVDFSGVEKFLDTPVKRYSSGMYVRLAFAVAAHLEPEILVVDEVLAVGDAEFQRKCLGKMQEVAGHGRTILFVSHNMPAVERLCGRVIWLDNSRVALDGGPADVVERYLDHDDATDIQQAIELLPSDPIFRLLDLQITQGGEVVREGINVAAPLKIAITYEVLKRTLGLRVLFQFCDILDNIILQSFHDENSSCIAPMEPGVYHSSVVVPADLLAPIQYRLKVQAGIHNGPPVMPLEGLIVGLRGMSVYHGPPEYSGLPFSGKVAPVFVWQTISTQTKK